MNRAQGRNRTNDIRIFSPPLYQLSYLGFSLGPSAQCRRPGSNRYEYHYSRDFKSRASASSATPARQEKWARVDSNHRSYQQQIYSLSPLATRELALNVLTRHNNSIIKTKKQALSDKNSMNFIYGIFKDKSGWILGDDHSMMDAVVKVGFPGNRYFTESPGNTMSGNAGVSQGSFPPSNQHGCGLTLKLLSYDYNDINQSAAMLYGIKPHKKGS